MYKIQPAEVARSDRVTPPLMKSTRFGRMTGVNVKPCHHVLSNVGLTFIDRCTVCSSVLCDCFVVLYGVNMFNTRLFLYILCLYTPNTSEPSRGPL